MDPPPANPVKAEANGNEDGGEWTADMDEDDEDECSSFAAVPLSEVNAAGESRVR